MAPDDTVYYVGDCAMQPPLVAEILPPPRRVLSELSSKFLASVAKKDDLVVLFFSTHGSPATWICEETINWLPMIRNQAIPRSFYNLITLLFGKILATLDPKAAIIYLGLAYVFSVNPTLPEDKKLPAKIWWRCA